MIESVGSTTDVGQHSVKSPSPIVKKTSPRISPPVVLGLSRVPQPHADPSAVITVVRDVDRPIGKRFTRNPDGTVSKQSNVNVALGIAMMHRAETHDELAAILTKVGDDPQAAVINASFDGIEIGEEFAILSEREMEKRLGIPKTERVRQKGVHELTIDGKRLKAVGRFKENVRPSCWQILDRDIDQHTPPELAGMSFGEWLSALSRILPEFSAVSYVQAPSTSSRVLLDGKAVGAGNGHVWIKVSDPKDVERMRVALTVGAAKAGLTWTKPRMSKKEPGTIVGQSIATIVDPSVWTPGRLVFIGRPTVSEGLSVIPLVPRVHKGLKDLLDTTELVLPDAKVVRDITRKAGVEMELQEGGSGLKVTTHDLTLNTEIDTEEGEVLTVRELVERGITDKIRCQTPFRDSNSAAGFLSLGADGTPFVFDVGTSTTHWLSNLDAQGLRVATATGFIKRLIPKVKEDSGAPLEPDAVHALAVIQHHSPAQFQRFRAELKQANKQVPLGIIDVAVRAQSSEGESAETHHGYAKDLLTQMTFENWAPVGYEGSLYVVDPTSGVWERKPVELLERLVAEAHDGKENCKRRADYSAIAQHAVSLADDPDFFGDAPIGLACPKGFYQIEGSDITVVSLKPEHRQRVVLKITPEKQDTPLFDRFLHETFESKNQGEEIEQIMLVQEIAGATMLGLMPRYQKAVQFYDPFGRAGKGTLERMLRQLVPAQFVTAVSPFTWHREYHVAALAGSRLNVVGELPDDESIPAATFKTVTGGDLITGRHPTHRPFSFKNEASHLFMSNHLINTRDHSEAFFSRWLIVEFPNSRLRTGLPLDPELAERVIAQELPGIAQWALEGAVRLLRNGSFSKSRAHDRLMAKWRRSTSSLEEFIHERCLVGDDTQYTRRSEFYREYSDWCKDTGRKPFSKSRVKELLDHNVGLGITVTTINGYEMLRGVTVNADDSSGVLDRILGKVPKANSQ